MSNLSDFIGGAPGLWVTGTAYTIGKVVLSPADFQYYVRKTNGAGATDPSADTTNWKITGNAIKSVQRGVIASTGATTDVTIAAVNPLKTELRYLGMTALSGSTGDAYPYLVLLNPTTVRMVKKETVSGGVTISWELTERY